MNLSSEIKGKTLIIKINEENIDIGNSIEFRESLAKEAEKAAEVIVLDMQAVKYIDSSGLGVLITFLRFVKDSSKFLKLANCQSKVVETLKSTRLDSEIPLFTSVEAAME